MISSAYTYYLSTYGGQQVSKYDAHKKSEIRSVYNNMLKINKRSPLYKIMDSENVQKYAIDLKESARALKNVASSLTDIDGSISGFLKKKAVSSNEAIVEAAYIGGEEGTDYADNMAVRVKSLAMPQINEGKYLNPSGESIKPGSYFFDVNAGEYTYEFSFSVKPGEKNEDVQDKLVRLFNRANIGVVAEKNTDAAGKDAITIESVTTGSDGGEIFSIMENDKSDSNIVEELGLNNIKQEASNANFSIDGVEHTAASNTFSVRHQYQLTLNSVSHGGEVVTVGVKQDIDSIIENVDELISKYNDIVDLAIDRSNIENGSDSKKLIRDINSVSRYYKNSLDTAGFKVEDDGHITVEESLLIQSAKEGTLTQSLEKLNSFKKAVVAKADDISINPMKYVDKKLITYPNPHRSFNSPYVSSIYSGMMFNGYV